MMRAFAKCLLAMVLLASAGVHAGHAQEPAAPSLDDELLEDLLDKSVEPKEAAKPAGSEAAIDRELMQDLSDGEDLGEAPESPLQQLAERMKLSQQRIGTRDTSESTQQIQQDISDRLARLIEQVEKRASSSGNPSQSGSGKPGGQGDAEGASPSPGAASESTQRVEQAERIERDSADVRDTIRRVWGHLPEKMREQMQNSLDDQFLPKYEKLIEQYYRRLAEQPDPGA